MTEHIQQLPKFLTCLTLATPSYLGIHNASIY